MVAYCGLLDACIRCDDQFTSSGSIIDEIADGISDGIGSDSDAGTLTPAPSRAMTDDVEDECAFASGSEASVASSGAAGRGITAADHLAETRWRKPSAGSAGGSSGARSFQDEVVGETGGRWSSAGPTFLYKSGSGPQGTDNSKRKPKKTGVKKTFNAIYGASVRQLRHHLGTVSHAFSSLIPPHTLLSDHADRIDADWGFQSGVPDTRLQVSFSPRTKQYGNFDIVLGPILAYFSCHLARDACCTLLVPMLIEC